VGALHHSVGQAAAAPRSPGRAAVNEAVAAAQTMRTETLQLDKLVRAQLVGPNGAAVGLKRAVRNLDAAGRQLSEARQGHEDWLNGDVLPRPAPEPPRVDRLHGEDDKRGDALLQASVPPGTLVLSSVLGRPYIDGPVPVPTVLFEGDSMPPEELVEVLLSQQALNGVHTIVLMVPNAGTRTLAYVENKSFARALRDELGRRDEELLRRGEMPRNIGVMAPTGEPAITVSRPHRVLVPAGHNWRFYPPGHGEFVNAGTDLVAGLAGVNSTFQPGAPEPGRMLRTPPPWRGFPTAVDALANRRN
jgi:hypothetical protein